MTNETEDKDSIESAPRTELSEAAIWDEMWKLSFHEHATDSRATIHAFAMRVRDRTRHLLEENPPPVTEVHNAVATIAGLIHALRTQTEAVGRGEPYDPQLADPVWISKHIALALSKIRSLLRDAEQREVVMAMAEDREPKSKKPIGLPVTTSRKAPTGSYPRVAQEPKDPNRRPV